MSEWQLKLRSSGPFKPSGLPSAASSDLAPAPPPVAGSIPPPLKGRADSVDYTPDGLSPELQDSGYDAASSHRPMGLAGLLGEEDSDE